MAFFRYFVKSRPLYALLPFAHSANVLDFPEYQQFEKDKPLTGWDRVHIMYSRDKYGGLSKELVTVSQTSLVCAFFGAVWGGLKDSKHAVEDYISRNDTTSYISVYEARRNLQDHVMLKFSLAALKWGARIGAFAFCVSLVATTISVYRGKVGIIEFSFATTLVGALVRAYLGFIAMCHGAFIGFVLGTISGTILWFAMWITGSDIDEIRQWHYDIRKLRADQYDKILQQTPAHVNEESVLLKDREIARKSTLSEEEMQKELDEDRVYILINEKSDKSKIAVSEKTEVQSQTPSKEISVAQPLNT